jgi:predicted PolB exonuclease-like 3'-5' exonuclease
MSNLSVYSPDPAFLVFDTESVPDGLLLSKVKYPGADLSPEEAVGRAQVEAREFSRHGSDFLPPSFQIPVALCVLRVAADFTLQRITPLGVPDFRTRDIVEQFWLGVTKLPKAKLVTFNGRRFDLPLLELAAFRYRVCCGTNYFDQSRTRFNSNHIDLLDWLSNSGACWPAGGLNLLSKVLGKPGKMDVSGDQVYALWREGRLRDISDYCMFDTLDTYFVFLRTRVMAGVLTGNREEELVAAAREWVASKTGEQPALQKYLDNWGAWEPWP